MKFKQKKLKAENFRYVTKEIIKNPMIYLDDFFRSQTRIAYWLRDINLVVNHAACSDMACSALSESGFHCRQLIEQVEVAYVIYRQCGLKKQRKPLNFFKSRKDFRAYSFRGEYTFNGWVDPADTLSKFFSYQSLHEWYETLDDMMIYLVDQPGFGDERFGDRIVVIRELLLRMAQALSDVYENKGVPIQVPSYFVACPKSTSADGRDELGDEEDELDDEEEEIREEDDEPEVLEEGTEAIGGGEDEEDGEEMSEITEELIVTEACDQTEES